MNVPEIIIAKSVVVNFTAAGGTATAFSTNGRLKIDNRSSKDYIAASNLQGGVDRPLGIRELNGYAWDYGDVPPINSNTSLPVKPNDLIDIAFTLDGATAVQVASSGTGVRVRALEVFVNPYTEGKENVVYYIVHIGGAGTDFSATASIPTDSTTPRIYSTKSLGVQFAYWVPTGHTYNGTTGPALTWTQQCHYAGMHLKIQAIADPDWSSCLNGIAYYPAGLIDASIELGKRIQTWPIDTNPANVPPMLTGQPVATPGSVNSSGDLAFPDLDSIVGIRMVTQVNSDLSPNSYWELLYGMLGQKSGEFNQKSTKPISVEYVFEKCGSMASRSANTGYDVGHIVYKTGIASDGSGGTSYQIWP